MKKYLPYANYLAAACGIAAGLLQKWALSGGADSKGLYPAAHPGWIGYLVVSIAATVALFLMTRHCGKNGSWSANFPCDLKETDNFYLGFAKICFRGAGYALAAVGVGIYSIRLTPGVSTLQAISYWGGFLCAAALLLLSAQCFCRKAPTPLIHLAPCLFFTLQLVLMGKQYGNETQLMVYLPAFVAFGVSALASYELAGFAVADGNRKKSLFLSLTAATLCFAAAVGGQPIFAALGAWHLMSHCSLTEPAEEEPVEEPVEEPKEETEETEL